MAKPMIDVKVVNNSGKTVGLRLEENGERHEYLKVQQRRGDIKSVTKLHEPKPKPKSAGASGGDQ
ncbi:hypothetical protein [Nocardiopsis suaedae]|uniref:50S ribosomal protein L33 n=1 Tax=Nocardiopsis suaedae TaxID=3018444 RepID=A0ABT4TLX9_9ACTN|nr:hypothetical protein [Nocardiopsis suaedae]MDA2805709.1 hypothetical protein [Nocardiopsis suaedae]